MKILGQVVSIIPLGLIISLPNQLYGHVPITQISSQFTTVLERFDNRDEGSDEDIAMEDEDEDTQTPDLYGMFHVGQYVRAIVTNVHAAGVSDIMGVGKLRDDLAKASRRMELSLVPEKVNVGVQKTDLKSGFVSAHVPLILLLNQLFPRPYLLQSRASKTTATTLTWAYRMCPASFHLKMLAETVPNFTLAMLSTSASPKSLLITACAMLPWIVKSRPSLS